MAARFCMLTSGLVVSAAHGVFSSDAVKKHENQDSQLTSADGAQGGLAGAFHNVHVDASQLRSLPPREKSIASPSACSDMVDTPTLGNDGADSHSASTAASSPGTSPTLKSEKDPQEHNAEEEDPHAEQSPQLEPSWCVWIGSMFSFSDIFSLGSDDQAAAESTSINSTTPSSSLDDQLAQRMKSLHLSSSLPTEGFALEEEARAWVLDQLSHMDVEKPNEKKYPNHDKAEIQGGARLYTNKVKEIALLLAPLMKEQREKQVENKTKLKKAASQPSSDPEMIVDDQDLAVLEDVANTVQLNKTTPNDHFVQGDGGSCSVAVHSLSQHEGQAGEEHGAASSSSNVSAVDAKHEEDEEEQEDGLSRYCTWNREDHTTLQRGRALPSHLLHQAMQAGGTGISYADVPLTPQAKKNASSELKVFEAAPGSFLAASPIMKARATPALTAPPGQAGIAAAAAPGAPPSVARGDPIVAASSSASSFSGEVQKTNSESTSTTANLEDDAIRIHAWDVVDYVETKLSLSVILEQQEEATTTSAGMGSSRPLPSDWMRCGSLRNFLLDPNRRTSPLASENVWIWAYRCQPGQDEKDALRVASKNFRARLDALRRKWSARLLKFQEKIANPISDADIDTDSLVQAESDPEKREQLRAVVCDRARVSATNLHGRVRDTVEEMTGLIEDLMSEADHDQQALRKRFGQAQDYCGVQSVTRPAAKASNADKARIAFLKSFESVIMDHRLEDAYDLEQGAADAIKHRLSLRVKKALQDARNAENKFETKYEVSRQDRMANS
ncbi:unnamed protein product [Amoebophrya sp. A25]|nr:unnamed protein product [Amoebophrya sp. A25]|eukprot:GSA25T00013680001.1